MGQVRPGSFRELQKLFGYCVNAKKEEGVLQACGQPGRDKSSGEENTSRICYIQALTLLTQRGNSSCSGGEMVLGESLPLSAPAASPSFHEMRLHLVPGSLPREPGVLFRPLSSPDLIDVNLGVACAS